LPPAVETFGPLLAYLFLLHVPRISHYEPVGQTVKALMQHIETKYVTNYSAYFALLHIKALAEYYQMIVGRCDLQFFELTLAFVDTCLDIISSSEDKQARAPVLNAYVETLVSPALEQFADLLSPQLITVRKMLEK
jgi:hypothetical protein